MPRKRPMTVKNPPRMDVQMTTLAHKGPLLRNCVKYRSEEHTSELQSQSNLVCRLLLEKKKSEVLRNLALELYVCRLLTKHGRIVEIVRRVQAVARTPTRSREADNGGMLCVRRCVRDSR